MSQWLQQQYLYILPMRYKHSFVLFPVLCLFQIRLEHAIGLVDNIPVNAAAIKTVAMGSFLCYLGEECDYI
jgi:hypothetical protein